MSVFQGTSGGAGGFSSAEIEEINLNMEEMSDSERTAYLSQRLGSAAKAQAYLRFATKDGETAEGEDLGEVDLNASPPVGCNEFTNSTPVSTRISRYYTLASLSSQTVYTKYQIVPNQGLSRAQIMCNLKHLATTSLDPIRAWDSKVRIGSGFRSNSSTDHGRGSAVDLYFYKPGSTTRKSVRELTQVARHLIYELKIPFTQLLLESSGNGTGWIHVANRRNGQRSGLHIGFSLNNGRTFTPGLPKF